MAGRSNSTAVAERPVAQVPDLVSTPALGLTAADVALPRVKIGQISSTAVINDLIEKSQLYSTVGQDDADPVALSQPLRIHVLALRKGLSYSDKDDTGGELLTWAYGDPEAHPRAWVTYDYAVCLPEVDPEMAYKFLLTKSGKPAAQQMNSVLMRAGADGPPWNVAFEVTTKMREGKKGRWWVAQVRQVEADPQHVEIAGRLGVQLSADAVEVGATGEQPDI